MCAKEKTYFLTLKQIIDKFEFEKIYYPDGADDIQITSADINRPGLALAGFFEYFDNSRIQLYGRVEHTFMTRFVDEKRGSSFKKFFEKKFPVLIITRSLDIFDELMEQAKAFNVPVIRTSKATSEFMSVLNSFLSEMLAPRVTRHGVLVEVYGEGVLLMGESGVGKSETAIELVKRGHLLVADDAVEISKVSSDSLVGKAPDIIKYYIELRGIGIINIKQLFGAGAVKESQHIDLILNLELWNQEKQYERLGMDTSYDELLGVKIPSLTIPVRPGRNIALIAEVAAMNLKQQRLGYNAAMELNNKIMGIDE